jgi:hypothetical protein
MPIHTLMSGFDLLRIHIEGWSVGLDVSAWLLAVVILCLVAFVLSRKSGAIRFRHYELVRLNVQLGGVGNVELRPNNEDIQIAHKIWTELVTRKAAVPIDIEHDVIIEIYDSWYSLFGRIRQLISEIPGQMLRQEKSTQKVVEIAIQALNNGLHPHLTRWQARFRHWYAQRVDEKKGDSPQDIQRQFPEYEALIEDIRRVNTQLIQYAGELEKIVHGTHLQMGRVAQP